MRGISPLAVGSTREKRTNARDNFARLRCAHKATKPTDILSDEYRVIERVLDALQRLTLLPVNQSLEQWRKALDFFATLLISVITLRKKKFYFRHWKNTAFRARVDPSVMLAEHEEGRGHVRLMIAAVENLAKSNGPACATLLDHAQAYIALLQEHIQKEDNILFRMAEQIIPEDEQKRILKDFEQHEAEETGAGAHEKYLGIARELKTV